ncbi:MAG: hypothetical protein NUW37_11530 [Planctomycetes bacterium]|nr:hypothetical protein [Planctomycetota bacterium]
MLDIFASIPEESQDEHAPLAERLRPRTFADFADEDVRGPISEIKREKKSVNKCAVL